MANKPKYLRTICLVTMIFLATLPVLAAPKQILLGPPDGGAESNDQWYFGTNGAAYLFVDDSDPHLGYHDFTLGNKTAGKENRADWRSQLFKLGPAADGAEPMTGIRQLRDFAFRLRFKRHQKIL